MSLHSSSSDAPRHISRHKHAHSSFAPHNRPRTQLFDFHLEPRTAPGKRGPTPTSCAACRRSRAKCIRSRGGKVGEEPCVNCRRRGIECMIPQEVTRCERGRKIADSFTHKAERALVAYELSAQTTTGLLELQLAPGKTSFALCPLTLLVLNLEVLRNKFLSAGRRVDELAKSDQITLRIVLATVAKLQTFTRRKLKADDTEELVKSAQTTADTAAIWRKPTLANFANLFLLYLGLSIDGHPEAHHYFSAAASQFRQLFSTASDLAGEDGRPVWLAFRFAFIDSQLALENGTAPLLSSRDCSVFFPSSDTKCYHLPSQFSLLGSGSRSVSIINDLCIPALRFFFLVAQPLARQFSHPASSFASTTEKDSETVSWAWDKTNEFESWVMSSIGVLRSSSIETAAFSSLTAAYLLILMLEYATLEHLGRRFDFVSSSAPQPNAPLETGPDDLSPIAALYARAVARYEGLICRYLRNTRNPNQVFQLGTSMGFSSSPRPLQTLASIFCGASIEDESLFPQGSLDKLASTTFLIRTLKEDSERSGLGGSIRILEDLSSQLSRTCDCSGDQAIIKLTASRPVTANLYPDHPYFHVCE